MTTTTYSSFNNNSELKPITTIEQLYSSLKNNTLFVDCENGSIVPVITIDSVQNAFYKLSYKGTNIKNCTLDQIRPLLNEFDCSNLDDLNTLFDSIFEQIIVVDSYYFGQFPLNCNSFIVRPNKSDLFPGTSTIEQTIKKYKFYSI